MQKGKAGKKLASEIAALVWHLPQLVYTPTEQVDSKVSRNYFMRHYEFWTYLLTNWNKTVLYTGITNNLSNRLIEHWIGKEGAFTTRFSA